MVGALTSPDLNVLRKQQRFRSRLFVNRLTITIVPAKKFMEWTVIEIGTGVAAANLATLRPLYRWIFNVPANNTTLRSQQTTSFKQQSVRLQDIESSAEVCSNSSTAKDVSNVSWFDPRAG